MKLKLKWDEKKEDKVIKLSLYKDTLAFFKKLHLKNVTIVNRINALSINI